jgi:hypothetical protein
VRQRDGGAHRDHVTAEQRQLHAGLPLGHAVTHGGHAAGELRHCTDFARAEFDQLRIVFQRPMGRQHIVIRGNDSQIRPARTAQGFFVLRVHGREAMRKIGTRQARAGWLIRPLRFAHSLQI